MIRKIFAFNEINFNCVNSYFNQQLVLNSINFFFFDYRKKKAIDNFKKCVKWRKNVSGRWNKSIYFVISQLFKGISRSRLINYNTHTHIIKARLVFIYDIYIFVTTWLLELLLTNIFISERPIIFKLDLRILCVFERTSFDIN